MKSPLFYAKVLLFGEYGIIKEAKGLTIPLDFYKGVLNFNKDKKSTSNEHLKNFLKFLQEGKNAPEGLELDVQKFSKDIEDGLVFDSTIPMGYGVGSSGALVAAIYENYAINKINKNLPTHESILKLKEYFGWMENYFHNKSSGIDPLICYLQIPLLIQSKTDIRPIVLPKQNLDAKGAIFLINSGQPGDTAPMVEIFMNKVKNEGFVKTLKEQFIAYNDNCIEQFLNGDIKGMLVSLKKLSSWALENFSPMIPSHLFDVWQKGIESNAYYLKLCGSGGGGYVLGFTPNLEKALPYLKDYPTEVIYRF